MSRRSGPDANKGGPPGWNDTMKGTNRKALRDGAPNARVHGRRVTREPEYGSTTITLEEWKAMQSRSEWEAEKDSE